MIDNLKVAILMTTKNSSLYLLDQLNSIVNQTFTNFDLHIADDGSSDATLEIIEKFKKKYPLLTVYTYKNNFNSFQENFLHTLKNLKNDYDYYCFCDHDDIWLPNKIIDSISVLAELSSQTPQLFCSRTEIIDANNRKIASSPPFSKTPSLKNAIVQSIAGGNTMTFNNKVKNILSQIKDYDQIVSHDWIAYLLVTANYGRVIFSHQFLVKYRDHESNIVGPNSSLMQRYERLKHLISGGYGNWLEKNINVLMSCNLPEESAEIIKDFSRFRSPNLFERLECLKKIRPYRQTLFSTFAVYLFIILRRI